MLPSYLRKDAFGAASYAHKDALFIHIVQIFNLNVVLPHFAMEQFKVPVVALLRIRNVLIAILPGSPFRCKMGVVLLQNLETQASETSSCATTLSEFHTISCVGGSPRSDSSSMYCTSSASCCELRAC
jgi:hypothetical protein